MLHQNPAARATECLPEFVLSDSNNPKNAFLIFFRTSFNRKRFVSVFLFGVYAIQRIIQKHLILTVESHQADFAGSGICTIIKMNDSFEHLPGWRGKIERLMALNFIQRFLIVLIVVNAVIMGLETNHEVMKAFGEELLILDHLILWVFIAELVLLIFARRLIFFRDPWCVFDFVVVVIALVPATGSLSVLRALRVLRILRLINKVESMRTVVGALLGSLPGLGSVFGLILIIFYVSSVIATNMFGEAFPERFGSLGHSFYTLFQIMTLEGWSEEDRKSTRLNSSHVSESRMPSSA